MGQRTLWYNFTKDLPDSWMAVDLGLNRSLKLSHYALRGGDRYGTDALRNWQLQVRAALTRLISLPADGLVWQASQDGCTWTVLKEHTNDKSLCDKDFPTVVWPVSPGLGFRHFKIWGVDVNNNSNHSVNCAGIELYGEVQLQADDPLNLDP